MSCFEPTVALGKRWLAVGAYERDNFGDLLLLQASEHYLRGDGRSVVAAAPFAADMTHLLDRTVPAYAPILNREDVGVVWTVGGGVGSVTLHNGFRMSASDQDRRDYDRATGDKKRVVIERSAGSPVMEWPYVPRLSLFPLNAASVSVANSVGLGGVRHLPSSVRPAAEHALRELTWISVRETRSIEVLKEIGVDGELAPDIVQTLALNRPRRTDRGSRGVVIQASDAWIKSVGLERFAASVSLSRVARSHGVDVVLAGAAYGHDSFELAERLRDELAKLLSSPINVERCRRPEDIVDVISSAKVFAGSSLHGRIVSCAYGVPRVGLEHGKVNVYAGTWDTGMPFGVKVDEVGAALDRAIDISQSGADGGVGIELGLAAERNMLTMIKRAESTSSREASARRMAAVQDAWAREAARARRAQAEMWIQAADAARLALRTDPVGPSYTSF